MIQASEAQALLEAKFQGVRKDGLAIIARSVAMISNTKEDAEKLINDLTEEAINAEIKAIRSSIDSEISKATTSHEAKLKEKYSFVEKVKDSPKPKEDKPDPTPNPNMDMDAIKAMIAEATKPLQEKISYYEAKGVTDQRREKLISALNDIPDFVKNAIIGQFEAKQFENEEAFTEFLTKQTTDANAFRTQMQGSQMRGFRPRVQGDPNGGVDPSVEAYIKEKQNESPKAEGKSLI